MRTYKLITLYGASLMMLVVASWLNQAALYMMASALASLLVVSYGLAKLATRRLTASRMLPEQATEGEDVQGRITLRSGYRGRRPWVIVEGDLPEEKGLEYLSEPTAVSVPPMGEISVTYRFRAQRFGRYHFGPVCLSASDPMGLFWLSQDVRADRCELLVYPAALPMKLTSVFSSGLTGINQTDSGRWKGFGAEPHTVREYVAGDPLRRIHWRTSARRSRLHVLEFESGYVSEVAIALDLMREGNYGEWPNNSMSQMVRNAAFVIQEALMGGSSVRLLGQSIPAEASVEGTGERHFHRLMATLAETQCTSGWPLAELLIRELDRLPDNGTLFLFTGLGDPRLAEVLERLRVRRVHPILLLYAPEQFGERLLEREPLRSCRDPGFLEIVTRAGAETFFVANAAKEGAKGDVDTAFRPSR